jgi:eukaryotic-like serine/threonine-protein kinase
VVVEAGQSTARSFDRGRYEADRFLGEGGRKLVYRAHDRELDRDVAVAVVKTGDLDEDALDRVRRETRAMARLGDHPHIVTVHDIGEEDGEPFIVSQYMAGGSVEELLAEAEDGKLDSREAVRLADQVAAALEYAHEHGVIHRDIKPANVWLTAEGTAKLGDFGLALSVADRSRSSVVGLMVGTVAYMAPEQALGMKPSHAVDIYSLGALLYEMTAGRPPFQGDDPLSVISQHVNEPPVPPCAHNPCMPKALEDAIMRMLAKKPEDRFEDASAVRAALRRIDWGDSGESEAPRESQDPAERLDEGVFVGREEEVDRLRGGFEDALSGRGRLLMVVGEAGIGKTRVTQELMTYARMRGASVLMGSCYEGEGAPAYWPWRQVVRTYAIASDEKALREQMGAGAADIAQVVPELKAQLPGLEPPPDTEPEQARFRLFDSATSFLKRAAAERPLLVVLEDLHWADRPSLLLLEFLARELEGSCVLVVGTYRDTELGRRHPLSQTLGELSGQGLAERIRLGGLSEQEVGRFIAMQAGYEPPHALVTAVQRQTDGNPFFVSETLHLLATDGQFERARDGRVSSWSLTVPEGVRDVIGRRLDRLSESCNDVLTTASAIGREFELATLERVAHEEPAKLLEALEEALGARVLAEANRAVGRYAFNHTLVRETLYEELSTTARLKLHSRIAEVLEERYAEDVESHLDELAYHYFEAAAVGDVEKAIDYAVRAGRHALEGLAYEEAAADFRRALQLIKDSDVHADQRCELLLQLGDALSRSGEGPNARAAYEEAMGLAREGGSPEHIARAALGFSRWREIGVIDEQAVSFLEEAVESAPEEDKVLRARTMAELGAAVIFHDEERGRQLMVDVLDLAMETRDPRALVGAVNLSHFTSLGDRWIRERMAGSTEIIRVARERGDLETAVEGYGSLLVDSLTVGEIDRFDAALEAYASTAEQLRQLVYLSFASVRRSTKAAFSGRFDEGEEHALDAYRYARRARSPNAEQVLAVQTFALRREQGRFGEIEGQLAEMAELYSDLPAWRCAQQIVLISQGKLEDARAIYESLAPDGWAVLPRDANWPFALAALAEACAEFGDVDRAPDLYALLAPYEGRNIVVAGAWSCYGPVSRYLGMLATTMSRWEDAERHYTDALKMSEDMGSPPFAARTRHDLAAMLLARDGEGDRARALGLLVEALDAGHAMGMKELIKRSLALKLRAQGVEGRDVRTSIDTVASAVTDEQPDIEAHATDGSVTILFSDIEGSTRITERLGDRRWMEVLRQHNEIVRACTSAHDGFEVKNQGDGFMIVFPDAARGLRAAVAMQRSFAEHRERSPDEPLLVRIGLHTGEAIREKDDFFGRNVILAARIADHANGGEILVSSDLREVADDDGDVSFSEAEAVELKGLAGEHVVHRVTWSDAAPAPA